MEAQRAAQSHDSDSIANKDGVVAVCLEGVLDLLSLLLSLGSCLLCLLLGTRLSCDSFLLKAVELSLSLDWLGAEVGWDSVDRRAINVDQGGCRGDIGVLNLGWSWCTRLSRS